MTYDNLLTVGDIVYLHGSPRSVGKVIAVYPGGGFYDQVVQVHWIRKRNPIEDVQRSHLNRMNKMIEYTEGRLDDMKARFKRAMEL